MWTSNTEWWATRKADTARGFASTPPAIRFAVPAAACEWRAIDAGTEPEIPIPAAVCDAGASAHAVHRENGAWPRSTRCAGRSWPNGLATSRWFPPATILPAAPQWLPSQESTHTPNQCSLRPPLPLHWYLTPRTHGAPESEHRLAAWPLPRPATVPGGALFSF